MSQIKFPSSGSKVQYNAENQKITVPNDPMIPFITGDGIGIDITPVMIRVIDAAVAKAYGDNKKINWFEVFAGEKAASLYGNDHWLPEETCNIINEYKIAIKGPLSTPVGGGMRSINVKIRQVLDL